MASHKVLGYPSLVKSPRGIVSNTDKSGFKQFVSQRAVKEESDQAIHDMKQELAEMKALVAELMRSKENG